MQLHESTGLRAGGAEALSRQCAWPLAFLEQGKLHERPVVKAAHESVASSRLVTLWGQGPRLAV